MAIVKPLWTGIRSTWRAVRRVWGLDALHPAHQVKRLDGGAYASLGEDPQFRMREVLPAGWYWLELGVTLPTARTIARLYLDYGKGETEDNAHAIALRSERVGRRLLWLHAPARLRLDPLSSPGEFRLTHFRLRRVRDDVVRQRMQRKLLNMHPRYRPREDGTHKPLPHDLDQLWVDYERVFKRSGSQLVYYQEWIEDVEHARWAALAAQAQRWEKAAWPDDAGWPLISVVVPTYNTPPVLLRACLDSVLRQSYPKWQLCIADDASTDPQVREILQAYAERDARIQVTYRQANGHISHASNSALALAQGSYVGLLDHDDELTPHALLCMAQAIRQHPNAQLLYSDEDKLNADGERCDPYFKPDYSPELLLSQNYFSHLGVYRRTLVEAVGGFRAGYEGSQDYDLVLRCVARIDDPTDIVHVPEVLYHWRMVEGSTAVAHEQKDYAHQAALRALQSHVDQVAPDVKIEAIAPGLYRQHWPLPDPPPMVSLIVPTRDAYAVLHTCLDSILALTTYPNYEILVVDNQSTCAQTLDYLAELARVHHNVRVLRYDKPFNFSAINNMAVRHAQGSLIGLINNDIEVINPDWLKEMASLAVRQDIGCVGAKLYYPDGTLQHGGVILGMGGVAGHAHQNAPRDDPGYFGRMRIAYNVSAVTGAVLLVRRTVYDEVGGLNEADLPVAFNDVDFCLRVQAQGYRNVWTPHAQLYHHESKTRGADTTPEKQARFKAECEYMLQRWKGLLQRDPYYNPNLSLLREDYSLCIRDS